MKDSTNNYLNYIGYTGALKADLETLIDLHKLHTYTFCFENITPYSHEEVSLDIEKIHHKFLKESRGGYCFEQNLLFSDVLKDLGFLVKGLGARVLWNQSEDLITRRSHMLLIVTIDGLDYLADVGFGGLTLTTPLLFEVGRIQKTTHEDFRIERLDNDYKLQARVGEIWKTMYRFDLTEQHFIDYEVANYYLYTNPISIFRNNLIAAKPVADGRFALSNNQLTFYSKNNQQDKKVFTEVSQVKDALEKIFNIDLPASEILDKKLCEIVKPSL